MSAHTIDDGAPRRWRKGAVWGAAALALVSAGILAWQWLQPGTASSSFVSATVVRGDLILTVTANGTLQPTRLVSIGSELSGTVARVLVDVNDKVARGQVLVELDSAKLRDQTVRSRAALSAAQADVAQAAATVAEMQANLGRLDEVARLSAGKVPSLAEADTARAALARAHAAELSARASVASASAALSTDKTNLSKASIRAPIDGVILSRSVEPGNAVAASLQAVTLFTLAEDLRHLRLQVNVDEADVGAVAPGQQARFTVSAYANRAYPARITRVAFGSTITDNVVTYITYLDVDNADLSLRPGMSATAQISATGRHDVVLVPNTALRFTPRETVPANPAPASGNAIVASLMPRGPARAPRRAGSADAGTSPRHQVWLLQHGVATARTIVTGLSDGHMTEVVSGDIQPGMAVITEQRVGATR